MREERGRRKGERGKRKKKRGRREERERKERGRRQRMSSPVEEGNFNILVKHEWK